MKRLLPLLCLLAAAPLSAEDAAKVFAAKCASCHGADGKGKAAMAKALKADLSALDLTDVDTLSKKDAALSKATSDGVGKMPGYKDKLSAEEIAALTGHLRSLAGAPAGKPAAKGEGKAEPKVAGAAKLWEGKCASCHGPDGKGKAPMAKALKVEPSALDLGDADTLGKKDAELTKATAEGRGKMPAYKDKLSEAELGALTAHLRALAGK